jgi:hypothetical protein
MASQSTWNQKLGMNWKTDWRYRHGHNYMPIYIRHAMQIVAQGMRAWGEPMANSSSWRS